MQREAIRTTILTLVLLAAPGLTQTEPPPADRDPAAGQFARGLAALSIDDYSTASMEFSSATRISPRDPRAWLALAQAQRGLGQLEGALGAASEAQRLAPRQPEILATLAEIHATLGDFDEALSLALEAANLAPENVSVLLLKSALLAQTGQADSAIRILRSAWSSTDPDPRVGEQLALTLWEEGRGPEAAQIADRALAIDPTRGNAALVLGLQLASLGEQPLTAAHWLETAQREGVPGGDRLYLDIGQLYLQGGNPRAAIVPLEAATVVDPASARAHGLLAEAYEGVGDSKRATQARSAADGLGSSLESQVAEIGRMLERGQTGKALDALDPLLQEHPRNLGLVTMKASILANQGRFTEAINTIGSARALRPNESQLLYLEGVFLLLDGRVSEAYETAQATLRADPDHAEALSLLGGIQAKRGDFDGAIVYFERALALGFDSRELRLGYAGALDSLGRTQESDAQMAAYRALVPSR